MFIDVDYINTLLLKSKNESRDTTLSVLKKIQNKEKLNHYDIAVLLQTEDETLIEEMFNIAHEIKNNIYGNRIVIFAPLYVSNFCVNNCTYCGYKNTNSFRRQKLSMSSLKEEVKILLDLGHKRLVLESGEDPVNCDINYILECIDAVYNVGNSDNNIRRLNVNIAATSIENYKKLKNANIGTYILFQETYQPEAYKTMHPSGFKSDYNYHLTAFDRAMKGGVDDVGGGVLFGLSDPKFEVLALMIHNEHLENKFGVGFHTISVPRLKKAEGMSMDIFKETISDEMFKKIVAIIRIAVPYTGIILSTRETPEMRKELINYGVSQISIGSCTEVGGYKESQSGNTITQFEIADHRPAKEVLAELINDGHLPSFCTACYRKGRTGDRFMSLAKTGEIQNVCHPNALMTFMEYLLDYGDKDFIETGTKYIMNEIEKIKRKDIKELVKINIEKLKNGKRDLYL